MNEFHAEAIRIMNTYGPDDDRWHQEGAAAIIAAIEAAVAEERASTLVEAEKAESAQREVARLRVELAMYRAREGSTAWDRP